MVKNETIQGVIGRKPEISLLAKLFNSKEAEFLALYGRRRVGKTYLIRQFYKTVPCVYFEAVGQKDGSFEQQLLNFSKALSKTFFKGLTIPPPKNWQEAFSNLTLLIKQSDSHQKIVIFLDELPWLWTPQSQLIENLDYIWNTEWSTFNNLKLIVCGSAASWMLEHFIYTKGGLHNRITGRICLQAFTLEETQQYLQYRDIVLNAQQVLELYMAMGGIPHYLKSVTKGLSAVQNINNMCFTKEGVLLDEFKKLYASLYDNSEIYIRLIRLVASNRHGISIDELVEKDNSFSSGGTLHQRLAELEAAGFIHGLVPYGNKKKGKFYRILDEYTYFYLQWIEPFHKEINSLGGEPHYWQKVAQTPLWHNWTGYAFESVCFKHIEKIRSALGIEKISAKVGSWRYVPKTSAKEQGAQIDLLFDRADRVITLCEIKSSFSAFTLDKRYAENLKNKISVYRDKTKTKKQIFIAMITIHGVAQNAYAQELIHNEVVLKDFF
jgi:predicted AAA+ superfamily ATPase